MIAVGSVLKPTRMASVVATPVALTVTTVAHAPDEIALVPMAAVPLATVPVNGKLAELSTPLARFPAAMSAAGSAL